MTQVSPDMVEAAGLVIKKLADVARAVGWQAGVGASETAGVIVSCLAQRPELIARFLEEGAGLIIDGEISADKGCLTFHRLDGQVTTPQELRESITVRDLKKAALIAAAPTPEQPQ